MKFKTGDRVEALDDDLTGEVTAISESSISVKTEEGFELVFQENELIKISAEDAFYVDSEEIQEALKEKKIKKPKTSDRIKAKERYEPTLEIDLHIHNLVRSDKNLSNFEMLNMQLDTARRQLEYAIKKRFQKVVFVHGVGEGVLRAELETLFNRYDNVKYYDADYRKYGLGATEVYIFQNY